MTFRSLPTRLNRIRAFVGQAASLRAMPALAVAAVARDNPFGHNGALSSTLGKWFGVVELRTRATAGELAFIDTHDLGHLISCEELLIEQTYDLSVVTFQPDLVVDCGSHIGLFTLIAGIRYPSARLVAYEPDPFNFDLTGKQLARFGARLTLIEAAVFTTTGESWFSTGESNSGSLSEQEQKLTVKTIDLAAEAAHWQSDRLLLKMDIEGAERQVLPQVVKYLPRQCAVFLEGHGGTQAWKELSDLLAGVGFHVSSTRERGCFIDGFALRG